MSVNVVRFGANAAGTDDSSLFLKQYTGSFLEPWRNNVFFWNSPNIDKRTVTSGKQFQYLRMAELPDPEDYVPGEDLQGQNMAFDEVNITPDKYMVAHQWIPKDQMNQSHFDPQSGLGMRHALKLARAYDRRICILACAAARQTSAVSKNGMTVHPGGNRVTRAGGTTSSGTAVITTPYPASSTGAANFRADLRTLRRRVAEDNCPIDPDLAIRPDIREVLQYDTTNQVFSRDFQQGNDLHQRRIVKLDGFNLSAEARDPNTTTNGGCMPDQDLSSQTQTKYQYNFLPQTSDGTPVALALARNENGGAAVGVVTFEDVQHFVGYYPEKLSWLVMSFMYVGAGILDPWCAGSVEVIT